MLKIGIIGLGTISETHAVAIGKFENVKLVSAADIDSQKCRLYEKKYDIRCYRDYTHMIKNEALDAVVIALPHGLHKEATIFCTENGVSVLLEKPMANTVSECRGIIKAVKEAGITFMIGHIQRYFPENIEAKRIIKSGKLGKLACITEVRTTDYFQETRPKWFLSKELAGGGILMNYGAHTFDKLIWMLESRVIKLTAKATQLFKNIEVDGHAQIFAEFENGVTANISYCGYKGVSLNETNFYFSNGTMKLCTGSDLWVGVGMNALERVENYKRGNSFELMWRDFITAIENNIKPELDEYYGLEIIKLIEQAYKGEI